MRLRWVVLTLVLGVLGVAPPAASAAVTVTRAELNGTALRVEGSGAQPSATITVSSPEQSVTGTADGGGAFRVERNPFRSSTCKATVSDGATSATATLSGCTPSAPPPPPPGPAPAASISPASLTFASQSTGTRSAARTVTVTNTGNATLTISTAALGGANPGDYAKATDGCTGTSIAAGAGCSVSITFAPTATGTRTATLTFTDNAAGSPHSVSISGTGAVPPAAAPAVALTPSSLTFAPQDTGTTSAAQSITVTNTGNAGLFINSAVVRGANPLDFTEVFDGCSGLTLGAGAACSVSVTFSPTLAGTRSATFILTDNAPNSPQTAPITGTGTTPPGQAPPPLAIDPRFFSCAGGVCDIGAGSNVFVNNFFTTSFLAGGGTPPYTWSGQPPAGLTLRPSGLLLGSPTTRGTSQFAVTVTDAAGSTATGTFSLTVADPPPPTPQGCQTGGTLRETLSGPAFNGRTPSGQATADETRFSGCGGFSILSVSVKNVNLPDGTRLWVTLDFGPVGMITLRGGSGTIPAYNMGRFGVSRDAIRVMDRLPDIDGSQQILIGGFFR